MRLHTVVLAAFALAASNVTLAQDVEDLSETIELFRGIPQVAPYFESAYAYAVWPRIGRGGLGIGGASGVIYLCRGGRGLALLRARSSSRDITFGGMGGSFAGFATVFSASS